VVGWADRKGPKNIFATQVFTLIGARTLLLETQMQKDQRFVVDLTQYGIPATATILEITHSSMYSSHEGETWLVPTEFRGGNSFYRWYQEIQTHLVFHPIPADPTAASVAPTEISFWVSWIDLDPANVPWQNLVEACRRYYLEQYTSAVIPANIAVEAPLKDIFLSYIKRFVGNRRANEFLNGSATYSD
jgi:hypothetical protein